MSKNSYLTIEREAMLRACSYFYHGLGFNITIIKGRDEEDDQNAANTYKSPAISTFHLRTERQKIEELKDFEWKNSTGIGCITGATEIRCIDIDGTNNQKIVAHFLEILGLDKNYEWVVRSGSNNGFHIYFKASKRKNEWGSHNTLIFNKKEKSRFDFKKIELRWNSHVVLPPSLHSTKNEYKFLNCDLPKEEPLYIDEYALYSGIDKIGVLSSEIHNFKIHFREITEESLFNEFESIETHSESYNDKKLLFISAEFGKNENEINRLSWIMTSYIGNHVYISKSFDFSSLDKNSRSDLNKIELILKYFLYLISIADIYITFDGYITTEKFYNIFDSKYNFFQIDTDIDIRGLLHNTYSVQKAYDQKVYGNGRNYVPSDLKAVSNDLIESKFVGKSFLEQSSKKSDVEILVNCFFLMLNEGWEVFVH